MFVTGLSFGTQVSLYRVLTVSRSEKCMLPCNVATLKVRPCGCKGIDFFTCKYNDYNDHSPTTTVPNDDDQS